MLAELPFLILLIAGFLAGCSAILLRRAETVFGPWLGWLSVAAGAASAAAFLTGFYWAATMPPVTAPSMAMSLLSGLITTASRPSMAAPPTTYIVVGLASALGGSILAGWALRVRRIGPLREWHADRFEQTQPYRSIRRPLELGVTICVIGLCCLRPTPPVWTGLAVWLLLWNGMLELGEWELRQRLPACRDYLRRTPRYIPRRGAVRQGRSRGTNGAG